MKAIETSYKGYRFRSRTEARWAIFFDAVGISYQYEPEGFDLGEHGCYLPDFYIPSVNAWVEIKGIKPTEQEFELAYQLHSQDNDQKNTNGYVLYCFVELLEKLVDGCDPDRIERCRSSKKMMILCGSPGDSLDSYMILKLEDGLRKFNLHSSSLPRIAITLGGNPQKVDGAVNKSRAARFEFGDSQKPRSR